MKPGVKVLVTVDVEEDNWASYETTGASTENVGHLPEFCELVSRHGSRPTFFVNRPPLVATRPVNILRGLVESSACEIGTHCHAWNTPPFEGPKGLAGSMMSNLDAALNRAKIGEVHRLLEEVLGVTSTSFRAGRWDFGPTVAGALVDLGYRVDSSVSPFMDWSAIGGTDYSDAPLHPYRFHPASPKQPATDGPLLEVPVTVAFLRGDPALAGRLRLALKRSSFGRRTKLVGLLDQLGLLSRRWLSPETSNAAEMIALARNVVRRGVSTLNFTLHSCALLPGATPFVRDADDRREFLKRVDDFLRFCVDQGFTFATLGELSAPVEAARSTVLSA